jgi:ABC-2 type transport system permease protein
MFALIRKEILVHFATPIFTVVVTLFLFLTGFAFTASITQISAGSLPEASFRGMFYLISILLLFICPFLTMKSFAEERQLGTMELLKTAPITDLQIVIAKYVAILVLLFLSLFLTVEYPIIIYAFGEPDPWPMFLSYVGLFLLGASFSAVGVFMSVLTQHQMLAASLTFVFNITLWFLSGWGGSLGRRISPLGHVESFAFGVLDSSDLSYYLLAIFLFLFLTLSVLEAERWK